MKFSRQECSPNEVFVECNASCEPNCGASFNNNSSNLNCGCVHGCVCKPGMIRSSKTGKCVSMTKCLRILAESNATSSCGTNEHYTEENSVCQASCFTINESKDCFPVSGCICNDGFVRDVRNGECIRIEKCPSITQSCPTQFTFEIFSLFRMSSRRRLDSVQQLHDFRVPEHMWNVCVSTRLHCLQGPLHSKLRSSGM